MSGQPLWLIGIAALGMAATVVAAGLLWFVVTNPVAFAQVMARGL